MNSLLQTPAVLAALVAWLSATPTGLADVARREALRRQLTAESEQVLTNQGLPAVVAPAAVEVPEGTLGVARTPPAEESAPDASPAAPATGDEAWWRQRIMSARESLERNQVLADAMQSRINALQTDVVNRDDPAQREVLRQQLQRALDELDRLTKQIAADEQAIRDIQVEARRQRVPPGWLR